MWLLRTRFDVSRALWFVLAYSLLSGFCKRGDACWFLHISDRRKSGGNLTLTEDEDEELCSICFEKPVTFGLLGISLILIDSLLLTSECRWLQSYFLYHRKYITFWVKWYLYIQCDSASSNGETPRTNQVVCLNQATRRSVRCAVLQQTLSSHLPNSGKRAQKRKMKLLRLIRRVCLGFHVGASIAF